MLCPLLAFPIEEQILADLVAVHPARRSLFELNPNDILILKRASGVNLA